MNPMRSIRIPRLRVTKTALAAAVDVLRAGGVVAFPTETAYGLAADPTNPKAVRAIYAIKGRARSKGLPLIAADAAQVRRIARMPSALARPAAKHWPGPLTVVVALLSRSRTSYRAAAQRGTVAIRVSGSAWARALARELGRPITATSANVSGAGECYRGADVRASFHERTHAPVLLLDAGRIPKRPPSTIVAAKGGRLTVLRQGSIRI
jgi:L-threonylcarbamoyladenylate synthase